MLFEIYSILLPTVKLDTLILEMCSLSVNATSATASMHSFIISPSLNVALLIKLYCWPRWF